MKIGLDIMGGDFAPDATVLGAIAAYKALEPQQQKIVLIGNGSKSSKRMKKSFFHLMLQAGAWNLTGGSRKFLQKS